MAPEPLIDASRTTFSPVASGMTACSILVWPEVDSTTILLLNTASFRRGTTFPGSAPWSSTLYFTSSTGTVTEGDRPRVPPRTSIDPRTLATGRRGRLHATRVQHGHLRWQPAFQSVRDVAHLSLLFIDLAPRIAIVTERQADQIRPEPGRVELSDRHMKSLVRPDASLTR